MLLTMFFFLTIWWRIIQETFDQISSVKRWSKQYARVLLILLTETLIIFTPFCIHISFTIIICCAIWNLHNNYGESSNKKYINICYKWANIYCIDFIYFFIIFIIIIVILFYYTYFLIILRNDLEPQISFTDIMYIFWKNYLYLIVL